MAFIVRKEVVGSISSCTPTSCRLISIRISARPHNITVIQVYAPTSDHEDEEIEQFYEQLDSIITKTPNKDILVGQAIKSPDLYQYWVGAVGRIGIGPTNDSGRRLLEFANSHRLILANTRHPYKLSWTATWHAPNGQVHNQIDFILIPNVSSPASTKQTQDLSQVLASAAIMTTCLQPSS